VAWGVRPGSPKSGRAPGKWCEAVGGASHHLPEQLLYLTASHTRVSEPRT